MLNDYLSDLHFWETLGLIMFGSILLWSIFSGISSLIQHWRRPERPDAPAPLPADDREDFIRDRKREEPNKREMPLPAPFRPLRSDDDIVTGDFDRMFLQPRSIRARSTLYVSSETKRKVLEVVRKVGDQHTTAAEHQNRIVRRGWKYARLAPRAIRMALRISISGDKFPAGGKTYIENYPAIDEARSGIELAVRS